MCKLQRAGEAVYSEEGKAQLKEQVAYYMKNAKTGCHLSTGISELAVYGQTGKKRGEGNDYDRTGADQKEKGAGSIGSGTETGHRSGWKTKDGRGGGHTSVFQGHLVV